MLVCTEQAGEDSAEVFRGAGDGNTAECNGIWLHPIVIQIMYPKIRTWPIPLPERTGRPSGHKQLHYSSMDVSKAICTTGSRKLSSIRNGSREETATRTVTRQRSSKLSLESTQSSTHSEHLIALLIPGKQL